MLFIADSVEVTGPLRCTVHGRNVKFIFHYLTNVYYHQYKNGGRCSFHVVLLPNRKNPKIRDKHKDLNE